MAESPLTVDRLFEEKWSHVWRGSSPGAHFSKQTGALEVTASSSHVPSEQWRDYVDSSSFIQPPAHRTSGKRASAAIEDDTASDSTGGRGEGPRRRRRVDACKTASVYSSSGAESSSEVSDSEGDPFSDAESVPRSASALSSRSHSPASTADSWDLVVDEISEGSYGIRSFSENEE
ncbi:hypothetical protein NM688_g4471 [Phlebia brevispora]|uniref:Uncharacterized protein n=1 Tax=Phlebia brevispora TaxID=194682 RepID=A0ACC1T2J4_9APHY|nr:hypothetical protein NM688_g4471 [Phlebia brevispora]